MGTSPTDDYDDVGHLDEIARLTHERDEARSASRTWRAECERLRHDVSRQSAALSEANTECEQLRARVTVLRVLAGQCAARDVRQHEPLQLLEIPRPRGGGRGGVKRYGLMYAASPKRDVFVFGEMKNGLYVLHSDHRAECEQMVRSAIFLTHEHCVIEGAYLQESDEDRIVRKVMEDK